MPYGLLRLDAAFLDFLSQVDAPLRERLEALRHGINGGGQSALSPRQESEFLIAVAVHRMISSRNCLPSRQRWQLTQRHFELAPLYSCKRLFVQRRRFITYKAAALPPSTGRGSKPNSLHGSAGISVNGICSSRYGVAQGRRQQTPTRLGAALRYGRLACIRRKDGESTTQVCSSSCPRARLSRLVPVETHDEKGYVHTRSHVRRRHGFAPYRFRHDLVVPDETNYCICAMNRKDSCSHGLKEKPWRRESAGIQEKPCRCTACRCPLEERISEFQKLRAKAWPSARWR